MRAVAGNERLAVEDYGMIGRVLHMKLDEELHAMCMIDALGWSESKPQGEGEGEGAGEVGIEV